MPQPTLQLADPGYYLSDNAYLSDPYYLSAPQPNYGYMLSADADDIYIKVPTQQGIIKVREDMFDQLDPYTYEAVMDYLEPFNAPQMNGLFSKWRENRKQRKDERQQRKIEKINARGANREKVAAAGGGIGGAISKVVNAVTGKGNADTRAFDVGGQVNFGTDTSVSTPIYKQPWFWGVLAAAGIGAAVLLRR